MIGEKFINVLGLFFVNAYMAKYLGAENFGKIAFVASLFVFAQTISWFGMENVLFKRMSNDPIKGIRLGFITLKFRVTLLIVSSFIILLYLYLYEDVVTLVFGFANCIASYFIIMDIFSTYNNSQLASHVNTITNIIGLLCAFTFRFVLSFFSASVFWFVIPIILIPMVPYILRRLYYFAHHEKINIMKKYSIYYQKYMYKTGGALLLSTISIIAYTQVSSVFLAQLVSYQKLGIYTVILIMSSGVNVITQALITSYFSRIYDENRTDDILILLSQINLLVIIITIFILCGFYIFGKYIVIALYGIEYIDAVKLIPLAIIAMLFSALGTISYRYMIKENGYKYLSIKMFCMSILSIPLSYILIYYQSITGAVVSLLLVECVSATFANYFFQRGLILSIHKYMFDYAYTHLMRILLRVYR